MDESLIDAKWTEVIALVDRLAERVGDVHDFAVVPGSSLAGDDQATHPFEISQAIRHLINAAVDQLHGITTLRAQTNVRHLAVEATLARAALENTATALWILGPPKRSERISRVLRWHARNYHDQQNTVGSNPTGDEDGTPLTDLHLQLVGQVATKNGLPEDVTKGYRVAGPVNEAQKLTQVPVLKAWRIASGFTHGRPWAFHGLLKSEDLPSEVVGHRNRRLTPRAELDLWLAVEAAHLMGELLRMRDLRAGL